MSATDADVGENADIAYSLQFPWSGVDGFQVDSETGVITALRSFDREYAAGALRFLVVASDRRGRPDSRSATATAVVTIVDVNDEAPVFVDVPASGRFEFDVSENTAPGTPVGRVAARDADHGRNAVVSYTLSSPDDNDDDAAAAFQIDRVTGEINTTRVLDREQRSIFRLVVTATDAASPPFYSAANVLVRVLDENDNRPRFVLDAAEDKVKVDRGLTTSELVNSKVKVDGMLTVTVSPLLPPGSVVTSLHAVDDDDEENAGVTYRLLPLPGCEDTASTGYEVLSGGVDDVSGDVNVISGAQPAAQRRCGLFSVDAQQGGLTLAADGPRLQTFDDGTTFNLTVEARDSGLPALTGTVLVRVVVNSTAPLPTSPTQRRHNHRSTADRWIAALLAESVVVACSLAAFVVMACCLSAVVLLLATRRARARERRAKHGYNCRRAEEQKALGGDDTAACAASAVVVYGSCESPRPVPACRWQDVGSQRAKRNGCTPPRMT